MGQFRIFAITTVTASVLACAAIAGGATTPNGTTTPPPGTTQSALEAERQAQGEGMIARLRELLGEGCGLQTSALFSNC